MKKAIILAFLPALSLAVSVTTTNGIVATDLTLGDYDYHRGGTLLRVRLHNPAPAPEPLRLAFPAQTFGSWGDYGKITFSTVIPANGDSLVEIPLPVGTPSSSGTSLHLIDSSGHPAELPVRSCSYQGWNHGSEITLYATPAAKPGILREIVGSSSKHSPKYDTVNYSLSSAFADPWPSDFRAYMRYSACMLTADEFADLPDPARAALADYAAAGGLLCLFGSDAPPDLPLARADAPASPDGFRVVSVGHGAVAAHPAASVEALDAPARTNLLLLASDTDKRLVENVRFTLPFGDPLVEHSPSVIAVFLLLVAFAVLAGPVLLRRLAKRNQRIRILWMLPALSLAVCALLAVIMLLANGITPEVSRSAIVLLDQAAGRTVVTGRIGILAPHTLRAGPSVERDAIFVPASHENRASSRNIVLGPALQLSRGWLRPGIPCVLHTRAVRPTHLRLDVTEPADGSAPTVRNLLGAPVKRLFLWDSSGALLVGPAALAPGASAPLVPAPANAHESDVLGSLATDMDMCLNLNGSTHSHPPRRFYVAELDGPDSPFLSDPLDGRRARHTARTLVLGSY